MPHCRDNRLAGVVRVLRAVPGRSQFFRREQLLDLSNPLFPAVFDLACGWIFEGVRQSAPADVLGQDGLLVGGGPALLAEDGLERGDCRDVVVELGHLAALAKLQVRGDDKVLCRDGCRRRGQRSGFSISLVISGSSLSRMYLGSTTSSASWSWYPASISSLISPCALSAALVATSCRRFRFTRPLTYFGR